MNFFHVEFKSKVHLGCGLFFRVAGENSKKETDNLYFPYIKHHNPLVIVT